MVQVVALSVFLKKAETASVGVLHIVDHIVRLVEIYLIIVAYYLALRLGLQAHFYDVA